MYNHIRWLSRGFVLQRFDKKKTEFPELFDNDWDHQMNAFFNGYFQKYK